MTKIYDFKTGRLMHPSAEVANAVIASVPKLSKKDRAWIALISGIGISIFLTLLLSTPRSLPSTLDGPISPTTVDHYHFCGLACQLNQALPNISSLFQGAALYVGCWLLAMLLIVIATFPSEKSLRPRPKWQRLFSWIDPYVAGTVVVSLAIPTFTLWRDGQPLLWASEELLVPTGRMYSLADLSDELPCFKQVNAIFPSTVNPSAAATQDQSQIDCLKHLSKNYSDQYPKAPSINEPSSSGYLQAFRVNTKVLKSLESSTVHLFDQNPAYRSMVFIDGQQLNSLGKWNIDGPSKVGQIPLPDLTSHDEKLIWILHEEFIADWQKRRASCGSVPDSERWDEADNFKYCLDMEAKRLSGTAAANLVIQNVSLPPFMQGVAMVLLFGEVLIFNVLVIASIIAMIAIIGAFTGKTSVTSEKVAFRLV